MRFVIGAHDWIRTSTSIGHNPLKIACLPISPREHLQAIKEQKKAQNDSKQKKLSTRLNFYVTGLGLEPRTISLKGRCSTN